MAKPWIGIPTRDHAPSQTIGQVRHYLDAVIAAGGIPLLIPTVAPPFVVHDFLAQIDGILLPGSPTDVQPQLYGAEPHARLGTLHPERDATDFALLKHADAAGLAVLGICFGAQSINVFRHGPLLQDIPSLVPQAVLHDDARHAIRLEAGSMLAEMAGRLEVEVNSFHHQSIERAGKNLRVTATAPDGVIEAVEDVTSRFVVGVQWHPERGWQESVFSQRLFSAFIAAAAESKSQSSA